MRVTQSCLEFPQLNKIPSHLPVIGAKPILVNSAYLFYVVACVNINSC